uniref:Integral membrane protein n=1 Tax=Streptomyces sp. NBC_01401 TaxID=2903854 RepID=A0AAU3H4E3_9ACTN
MTTEERSDPTRTAEPTAPARPGPTEPAGRRRDLAAAVAGALLVAVAIAVGWVIQEGDGSLQVHWPPLLASWDPHVGPGTPAAVAVAVAVVAYGPRLAALLPWRRLLLTCWAGSVAWIVSLALIEGWFRGIERRLTTKHEYLRVIDRFDDIGAALRGFTDHIVIGPPGNWPAHVAGHPPGATLTFVGLDRVGLGGGGWAGMWCIVIGGSAAVAVMVALRALTGEHLARRAAPFLVLAPFAVWTGTSADGYFAGVAAWSVALLALAATRTARYPAAAALGSGLLFGLTCYLSYGLTLIAALLAAVLLLTRTTRPLVPLALGALVVPAALTLAGFNWWEGYHLLVERYYQGAGGTRPYSYWVWGNLACATLAVGLATVAGLRRTAVSAPAALRGLRTGTATDTQRLAVLTLAALLVLAAADLSGMSKAETERIWQPFVVWLMPAAALLPDLGRRRWLAAQALVALLVNHLLWTGW